MNSAGHRGIWARPLAFIGVAVLVVLVSWWSTLTHMVGILWSVDVFAHGLLAPFVSITLIWVKRHQLAEMTPQASFWGGAIILGASLLWLVGELLDISLFRHVALVGAIQGIVLGQLGWKIYRTILFPMLFLFFSVPFGYEVVGPLQRITASMVISFLDVIGANYSAEGMLIMLPSGLYEVAEACAGVKFLFTSVFTGTLLSHLLYNGWKRKLLIVAVSLALPIFANVARVLLILLIAELSDQALAKGFDHLVYGWVFLSFVLFLLISIAYRFADNSFSLEGEGSQMPVKADRPVANSILPVAVFLISLLPLISIVVFPPAATRTAFLKSASNIEPLITESLPGYRVLPETGLVARPSFLSADDELSSLIRKGGSVFNAYQASLNGLSSGQRLFQPGNSVVHEEWKLVSSGRSGAAACAGFTEAVYKREDDQTIVWSRFLVGPEPVANSVEEKLQTALFRMQGEALTGKALVLSAPLNGDLDEVRQIFSEFLSTFDPWVDLTENGVFDQRGARLCAE